MKSQNLDRGRASFANSCDVIASITTVHVFSSSPKMLAARNCRRIFIFEHILSPSDLMKGLELLQKCSLKNKIESK